MKKMPLWKLLVEQGWAENRDAAARWIMAGKVIVNDQRAESAGELVKPDARIRIKGIEQKYVGKGGLKLEWAIQAFGVRVQGKVALDTGASTGGFTDCLLQHGASRVYAIDVGYGQLAGKLRADPRVVNMERTNIGEITPDDLVPKPALATVDLSYLSLRKAIPMIAALLEPDGEMICLVKPLFEIPDAEVRRTGVLDDREALCSVLEGLAAYIREIGFSCVSVTHSPVTGNAGTREFFMHISVKSGREPDDLTEQMRRAVHAALSLERYRKG